MSSRSGPLALRLLMSATFLFAATSTTTCGQQSRAAAKPTSKPIERASWFPSAEAFVSLTAADFQEMGLHKLTKDEYASLLIWANKTQTAAAAAENAKHKMPTYSCGRQWSNDLASLNKVRLFISLSEHAPSELASGIRQKIRSIQDAEIVYDEKEADIVASFVALENETESGRHTGFTVSLVTASPCEWQLGDSKGRYQSLDNHYLQVSPNVTQAIEGIVTKLDADDIEQQRKMNASIKRYYEGQKKP